MRIYISILLSILVYNQVFAQEYYENHFFFKVKSSYRNICSDNNLTTPSFKEFTRNNQITGIDRMFKNIPINHEINYKSDISLIYQADYSGSDINKVISNFNKLPYIEYAELEYKNYLMDTANDPFADSVTGRQPELWMHKVYDAWDITKGDSNILIAVSDAGTTTNHPDLINSIYKNIADPIDGVDNDNDGLIDNYLGWDFSDNDNDPNEYSDRHGTGVCGIAGATTNNGIGIASIGYQSKIVPLKSSSDNNVGNINKGYQALQHAAYKGYDIINLSWGCKNCYSQTAQNIVNYAVLDRNVVVISASGNENNNSPYFPASYDNVLSVSSVNTSFVKPTLRTWNVYVDLVAQGGVNYSTSPAGYADNWGTSFSSPMVASAAALVKSRFPNYSAPQIMEQLRVTTDSIYHIAGNAGYIEELGKGSMNVYRAVTDTNSPSIRNVRNYRTEEIFAVAGDTAELVGDFLNFLNPCSNLKVRISINPVYTTLIDSIITIGTINTLDTFTNTNNTFKFIINEGTPPLTQLLVRFGYEADEYEDFEYKVITINPDYIHIEENKISTSANSTGNFGYHSPYRQFGKGLLFNNEQVLFEAGLMLCLNSIQVSDNIRVSSNYFNQNFTTVENIKEVDSQGFSDFKATCLFTDTIYNPGEPPYIFPNVGTTVRANYYAWNDAPNDKFFIVEYIIKNVVDDTLKNLHSGIFADWDIPSSGQNSAEWNHEYGFGYVYNEDSTLYTGIKPLWPYYGTYFAIDNSQLVPGNPFGLYDSFSDSEKHRSLSAINEKITAGLNPLGDVSHTVGMNMGDFLPNQIKTTAFAVMVGESLQDLINSSQQAMFMYGDSVNISGIAPITYDTTVCEGTKANLRVTGGTDYLLYGGENDYLVLDTNLPLTTNPIYDTTFFYVAFQNGDHPGIRTPVQVIPYRPEIDFWIEPDTIYLEDRNYAYPHNESPSYLYLSWNLGNGITTNAENPTANYFQVGEYTISLSIIDSNNCPNYLTKTIVVLPGNAPIDSSDLSINNIHNIEVLPNPVKEMLLINNLPNQENTITLFDITGKMIFKSICIDRNVNLNLSQFENGVYIIDINNRKIKIIKN